MFGETDVQAFLCQHRACAFSFFVRVCFHVSMCGFVVYAYEWVAMSAAACMCLFTYSILLCVCV